MRPWSVVVVAALLVGAVSPACTSGPDDEEPDRDARVVAIEQARAVVGRAASEVGAAAVTLGDALAQLYAEPPLPPDARRDAVAAVQRDVARLREAARALDGVDLAAVSAADGADAAAADLAEVATARDEVVDATTAMAGLAEAELAQLALAADADERLDALVLVWDERGSRGQTLERLAAAVATADELADELAAVEPVPPCSGVIARREAAARTVAAGSRELRELVATRRGVEFDERREELTRDPGLATAARVAADRAEADCHAEEGTPAAGAAVGDALEALEDALNPADLTTDTSG